MIESRSYDELSPQERRNVAKSLKARLDQIATSNPAQFPSLKEDKRRYLIAGLIAREIGDEPISDAWLIYHAMRY